MLGLVCLFYLMYLIKALLLKRQGVQVNLLGVGNKSKRKLIFELLMRTMTVIGAILQFLSPIFVKSSSFPLSWLGVLLALLGTGVFIIAVKTMQDNWRAGFDDEQSTELVTTGIYQFSRNPAFVGFDCLYLGMALAFPTIINLLVALAALILFHLQITSEENYLLKTFGEDYRKYQTTVRKYF
ncbi:methyltransferase family protein [Enterococcus sp. AZ109]|uniref:methyltransferase family protein n=1 Tax=Enterococcus sp. AZ109 TaxID=2774634 RepID=UPI003F266F34